MASSWRNTHSNLVYRGEGRAENWLGTSVERRRQRRTAPSKGRGVTLGRTSAGTSISSRQKSADLGTLETGKLAEIVLLDGNPLDGYWNLLNVRVVIKGGDVVVDKR